MIGVAVHARVILQEITGIYQELQKTIQLDNKCETSVDCASAPTGSRACGGPNGYIVYSIKSLNVEKIRTLAKKTVELEQQYNLENMMISICSFVLPPTVTCNASKKCAAGF